MIAIAEKDEKPIPLSDRETLERAGASDRLIAMLYGWHDENGDPNTVRVQLSRMGYAEPPTTLLTNPIRFLYADGHLETAAGRLT